MLGIEKRFGPRITADVTKDVYLKGKRCDLINLSETGICFEGEEMVVSGDDRLSMTLLSDKRQIRIVVQPIRNYKVSHDRYRYGARLLLSDQQDVSQIRDVVFNHFAVLAKSAIRDKTVEIEAVVENFFSKELRTYHEELCSLAADASTDEFLPAVEAKVKTLTDDILIKANELEGQVSEKSCVKAIKQLFRDIAGCWFYKSPIVKMAYDKPRGYPGDYLLFETIYNNEPLADKGSVGFYCDNYFLKNVYARAARARKNKMKNILQDTIENTDLTSIKMLNVACGPSREIRELFSDPYLATRKNIIFTGLDNDEEALKYSEEKLSKLPKNIQVRLLHANVLSISREPKYLDLIGRQDIIYILGLTEYLPERIFHRLTRFLFQLLNENGKLVMTYKDENIVFPSLPPAWFCDWSFIKRKKEDLINTVKQIGSESCSLQIEREGTGTIYFLVVNKT